MTQPPEVSVIIPAFDEVTAVGEIIRETARALQSAGVTFEILLVDDGSTDGTGTIAANMGARVLRNPQTYGYGASLLVGIRSAMAKSIVILDADASYPPAEIPHLVEAAGAGGVAVGVRTFREGLTKSFLRWTFRSLVRVAAGRRMPDVNSGFRSFPRRLVLDHDTLFPSGFSFTTTLTLLTAWSDLACVPVPIEYRQRKGRSKVKLLSDGILAVRTVLRVTMRRRPWRLVLLLTLPLAVMAASAILIYGLLSCGIR